MEQLLGSTGQYFRYHLPSQGASTLRLTLFHANSLGQCNLRFHMFADIWGPLGVTGSGTDGLDGWTVPGGLARSPEGVRRSLPEPLRPGEPSPVAR